MCIYIFLYCAVSVLNVAVSSLRHEMQQFISVMEGYIVNQVLHVSWQEFQKNLQDHVSCCVT